MPTFGHGTTGDEVIEAFKDRVKGRTFLITGPSPEGIGAETAFSLAKGQPALLILAGRTETKIQPVLDRINEANVAAEFLHLDLSSFTSVRSAVEDLKKRGNKIDVLINNAAIMACPYALTEDNIETQFATNHLGPFLFTNLLLEAGLIGERIVNVSSSASVRKASFLLAPLDDLSYANGQTYDPVQAYSTSKIASVLSTRTLAARLQARGISVFSLNPGSIKSPLQRYLTNDIRQAAFAAAKKDNPDFVPPVLKSLQQGCSTQLRAALDPSLVGSSGAYLDDGQVVEYPEHVEAYSTAPKVWSISEELTGSKLSV